jgi:hypothetical protein
MNQPLPPPPAAPTGRPRCQWTPERQRRFLAALLETGKISHAAQMVGMSRSSAHRLRDRLAGTGFYRCRTNALALHAARLTDPLAPIRPHPSTRTGGRLADKCRRAVAWLSRRCRFSVPQCRFIVASRARHRRVVAKIAPKSRRMTV